jgi:hypothetical protein
LLPPSLSLSLQVVLSASICTKGGKALVSRQFVEMNRLRVEGLLAAFPKLVGHAKQHTYVETDTVRYVYQPLENHMYLLLITTKTSNIVEDLGTLRLLAKVVPDVAGGLQERAINENAFDIIFAFDEVLTAGGYKEELTLSNIRSNLEMDSHEEKVYLAMKQSKEDAARETMRQQAKQIKDRQMAQLRQNLVHGQGMQAPSGGMTGFGGGGPPQGGGIFDQFEQGAYGQAAPGADAYNPYGAPAPPKPEPPKVLAKGGMKLGGGTVKKDSLMAAMAAEDNLFPISSAASALGAAPTAPSAAPSTPLTLALEEKITAVLNREGGIENCEVKGTLSLTANTEAGTAAVVNVNKNVLSGLTSWNVATHPKVDKKTYEQSGVLSLKGGKGFPVNRPVGILRWSYGGEDAAPITINCWPEDEGSGSINVNMEIEFTRSDDVSLHDVNIVLPLGTTDPPAMESIDGQYKHDARAGMLCWHFDEINKDNASGSMEFSIAGSNPEAFFPIQVMFTSQTLLCPIEVTGVTSSANGAPIPNSMTKSFVPESYQCP